MWNLGGAVGPAQTRRQGGPAATPRAQASAWTAKLASQCSLHVTVDHVVGSLTQDLVQRLAQVMFEHRFDALRRPRALGAMQGAGWVVDVAGGVLTGQIA